MSGAVRYIKMLQIEGWEGRAAAPPGSIHKVDEIYGDGTVRVKIEGETYNFCALVYVFVDLEVEALRAALDTDEMILVVFAARALMEKVG